MVKKIVLMIIVTIIFMSILGAIFLGLRPIIIDLLEEFRKNGVLLDEKFDCTGVFVDKRDDNEYTIVQIGDQCWMGENLRYTENECLENEWNSIAPFNACKIHSTDWGKEVLYQWESAMDERKEEGSQGLCPDGWHIPNDDEWTILERYLGLEKKEVNNIYSRGTDQGDQLKDDINWNGTNSSRFTALPTGLRDASGSHYFEDSYGSWWSSSHTDDFKAWRRYLYSEVSTIERGVYSYAHGISVRCVAN